MSRKPGRGSPSNKPSCIDKLAKWIVLGLQGKHLLGQLGQSIIPSSIIIGNCSEEDKFDLKEFGNSLKSCPQSRNENPKIIKTNLMSDVKSKIFNFDVYPEIYFAENFKEEYFIKRESKNPINTCLASWINGTVDLM